MAEPKKKPEGAREQPHNLQAEESLLGALLLNRDLIEIAAELVAPEDFYRPIHGSIFAAIVDLHTQQESADPVTVADELARVGLADAAGGLAALLSLQANTPASSNAPTYARIVADAALLRRLIGAAGEISEVGYTAGDATAAADRAEKVLADVVASQRGRPSTLAQMSAGMPDWLDRIEARQGGRVEGIETGWYEVDALVPGLRAGQLVLVGARPSIGKSAWGLNLCQQVAEMGIPSLFFSIEMGEDEIQDRWVSQTTHVDSERIRHGRLVDKDWQAISHQFARLTDLPLWVEADPAATLFAIRSAIRRVTAAAGQPPLVVVDYLQMVVPVSRSENRQQDVAEISQGLKRTAREMGVTVVALSQLSRSLEVRHDKRPVLADLRDSGCMPAGARLLRADTGAEVTLGELVLSQEHPLVWSVDERWRLVPRRLTATFPSGVKPVTKMRLASGYEVEATDNHPFLTVEGWRRLDQIQPGQFVAVPRKLAPPTQMVNWDEDELVLLAHLLGDGTMGPQFKYATPDEANKQIVSETALRLFGITVAGPKIAKTWQLWFPSPYRLGRGKVHPMRNWLEPLGLWGARSHNKFIPESVHQVDNRQVALFLHHLWSTDGSITVGKARGGKRVTAYYSSNSRRLVDGVRRLLLRLDIRSRVNRTRKTGYRDNWTLHVTGVADKTRFMHVVGGHGDRGRLIPEALEVMAGVKPNPNVDLVPHAVAARVEQAMRATGVTRKSLAAGLGERFSGSYMLGNEARPRRFARDRLRRMGEILADPGLVDLATSDVFWDEVTELVPLGDQPTFDATVAGTHNFVANGVLAHNSLEQDADVVFFLYRDEVYNPKSEARGICEVIVAKQRNGPTGVARLAFLAPTGRFANMARVDPNADPLSYDEAG